MTPVAMMYRFGAIATLGLLSVFTVEASPIFVDNFSFETLPAGGLTSPNGGCGAGCSYSVGAIPGWLGSDANSGQFQPGTPANTTYFDTLPDGPTVAYSNGTTLTQTVANTVQLGVGYTLRVDLGEWKTLPFLARADLLINGTHYLATGIPPTPGNWSTFTATYVGLPGDIGAPITIELLSSGTQGDFDNVRLDAVPEPAGVTLFGLGLASLLVFARRKRAVS